MALVPVNLQQYVRLERITCVSSFLLYVCVCVCADFAKVTHHANLVTIINLPAHPYIYLS